MCRALKVSTSGYYEWCSRLPGARSQDNARLLRKVRRLHDKSDCGFGSARIWDDLRYDGETYNLNRVARLMKSNALVGISAKKQWCKRTSGNRSEGVVNHLKRDFSATNPNIKWVTDITYLRAGEGWLYLAVVVDLCHGQVVGWSISHRMETQLVVRAVLMALWQKKDHAVVILYSESASQYTSHEYQHFLKDHNVTSSMSAVGSYYDNAAAERVFGLLK